MDSFRRGLAMVPLVGLSLITASGRTDPLRPNVESDRIRIGEIHRPVDETVHTDIGTLQVFSLSINPVTTTMWPTWRGINTVSAATDASISADSR